METILHIGAHRTATTSLQAVLQRHRGILAQAGVEAWGPEQTRNGLFAGLVHRPDAVTEQMEWQAQRSLGLIAAERDRLAARGIRQLLISEENMLGNVRVNLREATLYPLADERLHRFHPVFGTGTRRVVLGLRSYAGFWTSHLSFGLTQAERALPDESLLWRLAHQSRRWPDVVAEVAAAFPGAEILLWLHEEMAGDPLGQITLLTGGLMLRGDGARLPHHNRAPGRDMLRHLLRMRGLSAQAALLPPGDGPWQPFPDDHLARMEADWQQDLAWLRAGAGGLARLVGPDRVTTMTTGWNDLRSGQIRAAAGGQDEQRHRAVG